MNGLDKAAGANNLVNQENAGAKLGIQNSAVSTTYDWFQNNNQPKPEWAYKVKVVDPELIKKHATILNFEEDM